MSLKFYSLSGRATVPGATSQRPFVNSLKGKTKTAKLENGRGKILINIAETGPAEICIYDEIGEDPWSDMGFGAKDLRNALAEVPRNRELHIRVNSPGGNVHDGFAIKNLLDEWPNKVVCTIDGVAASTASWMILGADEVRAPKTSQMFIHDAMTFVFGNAADMTAAAKDLDKVSDQIAEIYADKTGKSISTMRNKMRNETLLTGKEAKELGLVDVLTDDTATYNFTETNLTKMREKLGALRNSAPQGAATAAKPNQKQNDSIIMNREKMIALLNKWGVTFEDKATDAELEALIEKGPTNKQPAPAPAKETVPAKENKEDSRITALENRIKQLTEAENTAKRLRIESEIRNLIAEDKVAENDFKDAVELAMHAETGEKYLNQLKNRTPIRIGAEPLSAKVVELTDESFASVQKHVLENSVKFRNQFIGKNADRIEQEDSVGRNRICTEISNRAKEAAATIKKHKNKIIAAWNTNNIDSELQRQVILQDTLEAFEVKLLPLQRFSTVFSNIPLMGTDKIEVPYYPLQAAASVDWNPANGYRAEDFKDTNVQKREIQVGGDGGAAPANYARGRKWIGFAFSSYEMRRQPYVNWAKLGKQNANKLGVDIMDDIISSVITAANFGASIKAVAAPQFSGDDIADLAENATGRYWPEVGRSLALDHTYRTPLLKDPTFKQYLSYGTSDPLHKARIQEAYGFEDIDIVANLTNYSPAGENLVGWIAWMYAVLCAFSPIMPTEEVRALLTRYDVVVSPTTGIALEYRRFGDTTLDQTKEVVESSYGAAKGVEDALARLTSQ